MAKKAKWLEEGTNLDLVNVIVDALAAWSNGEDKNMVKAVKAASELQERLEVEEATPSVEGLVNKIKDLAAQIDSVSNEVVATYIEEVEASTDVIEEDQDEDDQEDIEEDQDDEDLDLTTLSKKALKDLCKEAGIKVKKGTSKEEMIEALTNN